MTLKAIGTLIREDYGLITPMLESAVTGWFVSDEMKHFEDLDTAYDWLKR